MSPLFFFFIFIRLTERKRRQKPITTNGIEKAKAIGFLNTFKPPQMHILHRYDTRRDKSTRRYLKINLILSKQRAVILQLAALS